MKENNSVLRLLLLLISLVLIGMLAFIFMLQDPEVDSKDSRTIELPTPLPESTDEVETQAVEPMKQEEKPSALPPENNLPSLDASDSFVLDRVPGLVKKEGILDWIPDNQIIRKFVTLVDNVSQGLIPRQLLAGLTPVEPFGVIPQDGGDSEDNLVETPETVKIYELDVSSYQRFDFLAEMIGSLDAKGAAALYVQLKPLIDSAFGDLGYKDKKFDDVMLAAIRTLTSVPVIEEPIYLVRPVLYYEFQDTVMESLSPAQKQMIRMGPGNTRIIQGKLLEFRSEFQALTDVQAIDSQTNDGQTIDSQTIDGQFSDNQEKNAAPGNE